jgi:RNA polymerase sigma-70 factor (ECF subfamily)
MEACVDCRPNQEPDEVLVIRALRGDRRGFDGLVTRYRDAAVLVAQRLLPSRDDVEDVVQESFIKAFRALPSLRDPQRFPFWLHRIVRHQSIGRRRQSSSHAAEVSLYAIADTPDDAPPIELQVARHADIEIIRRALRRLPEEYALPIVLHHFRGLRLRHIARFLNVAPSLVKWRLYRGRELLRTVVANIDTEGGHADGRD